MSDTSTIRVKCTGCSCPYLVERSAIPPGGAKVSCRRCGTLFPVYPDDGAWSPASLPPEYSEPPSWPGQVRALRASTPKPPPQRHAWVFSEDPAMAKPGVLAAICSALERFRVDIVDASSRSSLSQAAHERERWPAVVVFGDMQILLEDRLLKAVTSRSGVQRVLVSTHHNPDLIREAEAYCGFDKHLVLPLTTAAILDAVGPSP